MSPSGRRRRVYTGEHTCRLDKQRRVVLPKSWRGEDADANTFMLVAPPLPCIHMMPGAMFERAYERMEEALFANPEAIRSFGTAGSYAADVCCDKQGRISLTPELLAHARIDSSLVLVGGFVTISIWSPPVWAQMQQTLKEGNQALHKALSKPDNLTQAFEKVLGKQE